MSHRRQSLRLLLVRPFLCRDPYVLLYSAVLPILRCNLPLELKVLRSPLLGISWSIFAKRLMHGL